MEKINLMNDYNTTAHPRVLDAIGDAAGKRFAGYGADEETAIAAETVRRLAGRADADVHFLSGGTQTNLTSIGAFLRPHEAVVSPASSHIYVHETGAIEAAGHKIVNFPAKNGKADADSVRAVVESHTDEHMVKPKLLFVSQATELGTFYTRAEMAALREVCDAYGLYLYVDGARLANALAAGACDLGLETLAGFADAFYIGGTKNGLLFGEALVIANPLLGADFRYNMKMRGGLLAKGFLLGIQFRALLEDGLYLELAARANKMAALLTEGLLAAGVPLLTDTCTNQVFALARPDELSRLEERVLFERWGPCEGERAPVRFVTSWQSSADEIGRVLDCFRL